VDPKLLAIIQARCNSKRFPNKVLKDVYGNPLIFHVITRVLKSKKIKKIIVATSKNKSDDKLVDYLKKIKIKYYRGSLKNVAERFLKAAESQKDDFFLRVNGDSPLIDPLLIDQAVKIFQKNKKYDLITNVFPRTFPKGQSVEIIKTSILKKNLSIMNIFEQEHITQFFYKNFKLFSIKNFKNVNKIKSIKLAIDTKQDLLNILKKFKKKQFENYSILKS
tara:strand:+ start:1836 stop:2495 length:660 start_codon:yes stop_codon:yes gene_type:complete